MSKPVQFLGYFKHQKMVVVAIETKGKVEVDWGSYWSFVPLEIPFMDC